MWRVIETVIGIEKRMPAQQGVLSKPRSPFAHFTKPLSAPLTDCCELPRPPSAFTAFQGDFLSTFAAYNSLSKKIMLAYLRGTNTSESCPDLTIATPPPGNEPEAFSSLAFFIPAAIAAFSVSKPFAVAATTLFESRIS
jgi:hypothetical protein